MASIENFHNLDIRVGKIVQIQEFPEAKKPAYQAWVDFGEEVGVKQSSAQITELYEKGELEGKTVIGIVNLPPMKIASFTSECLILGVYTDEGVTLLQTDHETKIGERIG
ncbi:tRNA-binding protein [Marinococcus halophilus]|uniref:tRNA-binding protein n=1 Tax=Marinococcus halophilus TaxID=1371 RepID=A0A510Y558_MARHA|nr:tRNA-binding protein [Marinococcus halophilus]OZT80403.1 tRNA-binding protein [Marinococcus halophilus]GEK58470.1 tRNA-binding protein [Marinococcus halophilus]